MKITKCSNVIMQGFFFRKQLFILSVLQLFLFVARAQTAAAVGMQAEFDQLSRYASKTNRMDGFQSYSSGKVIGTQFFDPNWTSGTVISTNKQLINCIGYLFLFDKVRQQLFIRSKDSSTVLLAEKNRLLSFTLFTDKPHVFMKASFFDASQTDNFWEALIDNDSAYTLLKQVNTQFIKADTHDMQKMKSGENYDEFKDEVCYFLSYKNRPSSKIILRTAAIRKLFPEALKPALETFFEKNNDREMDENYLIKLITYINDLGK